MFRLTLSLKVLGVFVISGLISATLVGLVVYNLLISNALNKINSFHRIIAEQTLDKIDRHIRNSMLNIQTFSQEYIFQESLLNINQNNSLYAYNRLNDLLSLSGPWNMLILTDAEGKYLVTSHRVSSELSLNNDAIHAHTFQELASNDLYVSDLIFSSNTGGLTMIIAAKVIDKKHPKHKISGILIGHLAWPAIQEILTSNKPSNSDFYLYNKDKQLIATTDKDVSRSSIAIFLDENTIFSANITPGEVSSIGRSQYKQSTVIRNGATESGYLDYSGNDWFLSIEIEESTVLQSATKEATWLAFIISLLVIVASFIPAFYVHRRVSQPIIHLSNAIKLESRHENFPTLYKKRNDEIGLLFNSVGSMLTIIEKDKNKLVISRDELQAMVDEQTLAIKSSEERQRIIFDSALDAIITVDEYGHVVEINPAAKNIFGLHNKEVKGKELVDIIIPPSFRNKYRSIFHQYQKNGKQIIQEQRIEINAIRTNGEEFPAELTIASYTLKGHRFFTGFLRDITESKATDRLKSEFISTVSHELRTPLTAIHGSLSLIASGVLGELPEKAVQIVKVGEKNSQRLISLVNDLLDMEKLQSGQMKFYMEKVSLTEIVNDSIQLNHLYANEKKVTLNLMESEPDAFVNGDKERLAQVLTNLLSNAAKFSPAGGSVDVSLSRQGSIFRVSVTDHGNGISEEFKDKIFSRFSQANSTMNRNMGGTGLGLYISRIIVEKHNGIIDYESEPGNGAIFYVELPEYGMG